MRGLVGFLLIVIAAGCFELEPRFDEELDDDDIQGAEPVSD